MLMTYSSLISNTKILGAYGRITTRFLWQLNRDAVCPPHCLQPIVLINYLELCPTIDLSANIPTTTWKNSRNSIALKFSVLWRVHILVCTFSVVMQYLGFAIFPNSSNYSSKGRTRIRSRGGRHRWHNRMSATWHSYQKSWIDFFADIWCVPDLMPR